MSEILRVANCSGFYGDKLSAALEMVEGGPIDVLTGDYLAELTMAILYNQQQSRGGNAGYVGTFLKQLRDVVAPCAAKGIKIVSNAGGLGIITGLTQRTPADLANEIARCRDMTDKPIGVNLTFLPSVNQPDYPGYIKSIIEGGVKVVETS